MRIEIENPKENEIIETSGDIIIQVNAECVLHISQKKEKPYYLNIRNIGETFEDTISFNELVIKNGLIKIR